MNSGQAEAQNLPAEAYTVSGIVVDITATNAAAARDQAFGQAQSKAWAELQKRIADTGGKLPDRDGASLARSVASVDLESEKSSAVRYIGTFTVRFKQTAVAEALGASGTEDVAQALRPYVVLPVVVERGRANLWDDRTTFRTAWEEAALQNHTPPMIVPPGTTEDLTLISADEASSLDATALARVAAHYQAAGVVVPVLADGQIKTAVVDVNGGLTELPDLSSEDPAAAIMLVWKNMKTMQASAPENLPAATNFMTVVASFNNLGEWPSIKNRLRRVRAIEESDVQRFSRSQAEIALRFKGDTNTLSQALAREGLRLMPPAAGNNVWYLIRAEG